MRSSISFARRLSGKLIRMIAVLFVVVILALISSGYLAIYKFTVKDCEASLESSILNMEKLLGAVESSTESSAWIIPQVYGDPGMLSYIAENIIKTDKYITSCSIAFAPYAVDEFTQHYCHTAYRGENGQIASQIVGGDTYDYPLMDWYLIPKLLGKSYWSDPALDDTTTGKLVASYSKPLYLSNGSFFGVIKCDVEIHDILARMEENKPYEHAYCAMIGHNSSYYSADQTNLVDETLFTIAEKVGGKSAISLAENVLAGKSGVMHLKSKAGSAIAMYGPVMNGWSNILVCPYSDILSALKASNIIFLLVAMASLLFLYLISKKTISRMTQPITEFAYAAMSIGQGNFKTKIPDVDTQDELKRLSDSLHYMENSIDGYITELRKTTASNERFESELNIANQIQMQMLPHEFPDLEEIDLFMSLKPAREVGGDLYDFFIKDRKLYFIVGDVSGKGVPAALFMAITKASFRTIAGLNIPVSEIASKINDSFCSGNESGMFVTLFFGCIDLDTLKMEFCNCGHNPVVIIDKDGKASYFKAIPNIAAGLFEGFPYRSESMQFEKGMRMLVYTDGVTEAENKAKDQYGEERLLEFSSKISPAAASKEFVKAIEKSVKAFTGKNPQNDDITIASILFK